MASDQMSGSNDGLVAARGHWRNPDRGALSNDVAALAYRGVIQMPPSVSD